MVSSKAGKRARRTRSVSSSACCGVPKPLCHNCSPSRQRNWTVCCKSWKPNCPTRCPHLREGDRCGYPVPGIGAERLPPALDAVPEIHRVMGELQVIAQNDVEREQYEA